VKETLEERHYASVMAVSTDVGCCIRGENGNEKSVELHNYTMGRRDVIQVVL
jgi:hypothetical protein